MNLSLERAPSTSMSQYDLLAVQETMTIGPKYLGLHLALDKSSVFLLST
jgi:hypothetical protein